MALKRILEDYCRTSRQKVNLEKSIMCFSSKIMPRERHAIRMFLGISMQDGLGTYLGVSVIGRRL